MPLAPTAYMPHIEVEQKFRVYINQANLDTVPVDCKL